MPPCVSVSRAGYRYHGCHFCVGERDISCLGGTNFLLMNSAHLHNSQPCSHPHTADRFIIVCQESAGFTFQQNGPIWWANRCTRTPSIATLATTCQIVSTPLPLTPPFQPTCRPTQAQPDSGCGYMFLSQASCQILFHFMFFFFQAGEMGEERVILTIWITLCAS